MRFNIIPIFIVLFLLSCETAQTAINFKKKQIKKRVQVRIECLASEAEILKDIGDQCIMAFADEVKKLKRRECKSF